MKCPKCGYERQPRDNQYVPATECPSCGIVYSKSGPSPDFPGRTFSGPLSDRPSPLDEGSLKKARERVEMRLRKQLEARVKDEKHARTLERARQITSLALQQRKAMQQKTTKRAEKKEDTAVPALKAVPPLDTEEEAIVNLVDIAVKGSRTGSAAENAQTDPAAAPSGPAPAEEAAPSPPEPQPDTPPQTVAEDASPEPAVATEPSGEKVPELPAEPASPKKKPDHEHVVSLASSRSQKAKKEKDAAVSPVPAHGHADGYPLRRRAAGGGLVRLLPAVAWMILLAGVIGAVLSWTTIRDVEASLITTPVPDLKTLPIGLLLGFAYLATGVLGFAFFWVSSLISRQLRDIRHLLFNLPLPQLAAKREEMSPVDGENDAEA